MSLYPVGVLSLLLLTICLSQDLGAEVFKEQFEGYKACLIVQDDSLVRTYNVARTQRRFSPCSTFKVPHAVFALHYGVTSPDEVFKWDGTPRQLKRWERDHTLASAIEFSAFPVFQEIAGRIGEDLMKSALSALDYGNKDTSGGLDKFWLTSSLSISANEQVRLLEGLIKLEWPFSRSAQRWVKVHLLVEEGSGYRVYGKTGSGIIEEGRQIGWWIGWVESGDRTTIFVGNYEGKDAMGHRMRPKVDTVLRAMGILPAA